MPIFPDSKGEQDKKWVYVCYTFASGSSEMSKMQQNFPTEFKFNSNLTSNLTQIQLQLQIQIQIFPPFPKKFQKVPKVSKNKQTNKQTL